MKKRVGKNNPPSLPLEPLAQAVLGYNYELSVVWCPASVSRRLNFVYRGKDKPTNVLSFPLDKKMGELFLTWPLIKKEAAIFGRTASDHALFLLIHGLLHLKGMDHGSKMEAEEKKLFTYWSNEKHRHGLRHRHVRRPGGRRRMEAR